MRTGAALLVLAGATVLGLLLTLLAGREPGVLLGVFVIAGSLVAVLGVRRTAVYVLFPLPAIAFFCAAMATGIVHDSELASSTAGLGASFVQWVGGIFLPMVIATVLVVRDRRGALAVRQPARHRARPARAAPGRPGPSRRRPGCGRPDDLDSWAAEDPFDGTGPQRRQTGPTPRPGRRRQHRARAGRLAAGPPAGRAAGRP